MPSCQLLKKFQSTLPVRGATVGVPSSDTGTVFQSTLPVRGATCPYCIRWSSLRFQSTLPVRGATLEKLQAEYYRVISIHAPREGSDRAVSPVS